MIPFQQGHSGHDKADAVRPFADTSDGPSRKSARFRAAWPKRRVSRATGEHFGPAVSRSETCRWGKTGRSRSGHVSLRSLIIPADASVVDRTTNDASSQVTALLSALRGGDAAAKDELLTVVYPELRRIAAHYMQQE